MMFFEHHMASYGDLSLVVTDTQNETLRCGDLRIRDVKNLLGWKIAISYCFAAFTHLVNRSWLV